MKIIREENFGAITLEYRAKDEGGSYLYMDLGDSINVWASGSHPDQHWPSFMHELALALARVDGTFAVVAKNDYARDKRLADSVDRLTSRIGDLLEERRKR